jgi:5-aminolevulinate synthase
MMLEGTLAKAFGCIDGHIAGKRTNRRRAVVCTRFHLHDCLAAADLRPATAAIRHLKGSNWERERHQERAARVKDVLNMVGLPRMPSHTHIVPILVGDLQKCKAASDLLLSQHGIYIPPINYPTVPRIEAAADYSVSLSRRRASGRPLRSAHQCLAKARASAQASSARS